MNDSKDHKAAAEPPLDCLVGQRIERYLRQLAPHQNEREGPTLLREALAEIERLRGLIKAHVNASNNDDSAGDTFGALMAEVPNV